MVPNAETPSGVMYSCFKQFASININELAAMVFSPAFSYGGVPIHDRLGERTFLSRYVTHAAPGDFSERAFSDFPRTAERVSAQVLTRYPGAAGHETVVAYFAGEACEAMCESLRAYGLNDVLYRNIISRLHQMELSSDTDKATLLILQFIATGCLGDPSRATEITQDYSRRILASGFRTVAAHEGEFPQETLADETSAHLGLCRIVGSRMRMPAYPLATDEHGTEIGSLVTKAGAINDVDETVSKRHLRIFRDADGRWFAQGLGSTNGTTVIRGDSKREDVIEPPRNQRSAGEQPRPVRIYPSDILCLADTTRFMVLEMAE